MSLVHSKHTWDLSSQSFSERKIRKILVKVLSCRVILRSSFDVYTRENTHWRCLGCYFITDRDGKYNSGKVIVNAKDKEDNDKDRAEYPDNSFQQYAILNVSIRWVVVVPHLIPPSSCRVVPLKTQAPKRRLYSPFQSKYLGFVCLSLYAIIALSISFITLSSLAFML